LSIITLFLFLEPHISVGDLFRDWPTVIKSLDAETALVCMSINHIDSQCGICHVGIVISTDYQHKNRNPAIEILNLTVQYSFLEMYFYFCASLFRNFSV